MTFSRISCQQAAQLINDQQCQLLDIRDKMSYLNGHPQGAQHLDNDNFSQFLAAADKQAPTLVFCYHGNSSQQVAAVLAQQGFGQVYSVDGGAELWRQQFPDATVKGN